MKDFIYNIFKKFQKKFIDKVPLTDTLDIQIKRALYKRYLIVAQSLYVESQPRKESPEIGEERKGKLIVCLITVCFALESFVNDLININYPNSFADIEYSSLKDKVKFLYNAKNIAVNKNPDYQTLARLINSRNIFAHYKPSFRSPTDDIEKEYEELDHNKIEEYYISVIRTFKDIVKKYEIESEFDWLMDYSELLKPEIVK